MVELKYFGQSACRNRPYRHVIRAFKPLNMGIESLALHIILWFLCGFVAVHAPPALVTLSSVSVLPHFARNRESVLVMWKNKTDAVENL